MYYDEGEAARFKSGKAVNFPATAREVKANWLPQSVAEQAFGHKVDPSSYVNVQDSHGNTWLLVAMHIVSKEIPIWVWATFEHKNNPCYGKYLPAQDSFGLSKDGKVSPALLGLMKEAGLDPKPWANYRLEGAEVTFTDTTGRPIILGNSVTEYGFHSTASCTTCHARSTTDSTGSGLLSVFDSNNQSLHGTPDPN